MSQKERDLIERQIAAIKNDSRYKKMLIGQRGAREEHKFRDMTAQLNALQARKTSMGSTSRIQKNANGRIISKGVTLPKREIEEEDLEQDGEEPIYQSPTKNKARKPRSGGVVKPVPRPGLKQKQVGKTYGRKISSPLQHQVEAEDLSFDDL
jgi:hypothetical protein